MAGRRRRAKPLTTAAVRGEIQATLVRMDYTFARMDVIWSLKSDKLYELELTPQTTFVGVANFVKPLNTRLPKRNLRNHRETKRTVAACRLPPEQSRPQASRWSLLRVQSAALIWGCSEDRQLDGVQFVLQQCANPHSITGRRVRDDTGRSERFAGGIATRSRARQQRPKFL